jgi:hypothetical protein
MGRGVEWGERGCWFAFTVTLAHLAEYQFEPDNPFLHSGQPFEQLLTEGNSARMAGRVRSRHVLMPRLPGQGGAPARGRRPASARQC